MIKYVSKQIVYQEIPTEVSLAFSISGCTNFCKGCHSSHLLNDNGNELSLTIVLQEIEKYKDLITCVLFLGGDNKERELKLLLQCIREYGIKTALYSGRSEINENLMQYLDYYKIGDYRADLGGLDSRDTNQRLYKIESNEMIDITEMFWRKSI